MRARLIPPRTCESLAIYCQEVRPFTDKQIELVKSFASQAVIAIENTRLLKELCQRTSDLSEALERQTATSEVLEVISSSPGELEPVFEAMLEKAVRICEAKFGTLYLSEGNGFRAVAMTTRRPHTGKRANVGSSIHPRIAGVIIRYCHARFEGGLKILQKH